MKRRPLLVLLVLLVAVALAAGALMAVPLLSPGPSPTTRFATARLVVSLPRAGARRPQTDGIMNAVRLAVAEVNARVVSRDTVFAIEVDARDSSDDAGVWREEIERANAESAVNDPATVAYIGPGTATAARVVAPIAARGSLVVISPVLTAPALTKRGYDDDLYAAMHPSGARVFARVIPADDVQAAAMAHWAKEGGLAPAAVVSDESAYGRTLAKAFGEAAGRVSLALAAGEPARFVYLAGTAVESFAERIPGLRQPAQSVVGGSEVLLSDAFLTRAGATAQGTVATFVGRPVERYSGPAAEFARAYRDRYAQAPDPYAIFGYEAARLALDAVSRAGADRSKVREAVFATKDFESALGTWSIDAQGDTTFASFQLYVARALPGQRIAWAWDREIKP
jgi:branched-chain amino acid transport system substrate-binding protein